MINVDRSWYLSGKFQKISNTEFDRFPKNFNIIACQIQRNPHIPFQITVRLTSKNSLVLSGSPESLSILIATRSPTSSAVFSVSVGCHLPSYTLPNAPLPEERTQC